MRIKYSAIFAFFCLFYNQSARAQELSFVQVIDTILKVENTVGTLTDQIFEGVTVSPPEGKVWKLVRIVHQRTIAQACITKCADGTNYTCSPTIGVNLLLDDGLNKVSLSRIAAQSPPENNTLFNDYNGTYNPVADLLPIWLNSNSTLIPVMTFFTPTDGVAYCMSEINTGLIYVSILEFNAQ